MIVIRAAEDIMVKEMWHKRFLFCNYFIDYYSDNNVQHQDDSSENDCVLSEWTDWSNCSVDCGIGFAHRSRTIVYEPTNGGAACPRLSQTKRCRRPACQ